jgi:holo-[acyl-carrier protein] synthase
MIKNIGIDLENINRFRGKPFESNKTFYNKIFTKRELKYCFSKKDPYPSITARFCAKEAAIKALGKNNLEFKDIEVFKNKNFIFIKIKKLNKKLLCSISHSKDYAVAIVL